MLTDEECMMVAENIRTWSPDPSTKVGAAAFVSGHFLAAGRNHIPGVISQGGKAYFDRKIKYPRTIHAEVAALRKEGADTLYCTMYPCADCAAYIVFRKVKRVVSYPPTDDYLSRWRESYEEAKSIFSDAGIEVVLIPRKG